LVACAGAFVGIALLAVLLASTGAFGALPLVAPIGASAVLVFAVPTSPLAQPWPVIGGNFVSALAGIGVAAVVPVPEFAVGLAVAAAILGMSLARCLHPPGGAVALLMVLAGSSEAAPSILLVGSNSVALVAAAWAFHRIGGRAYPHHASPAEAERRLREEGLRREDVERALGDMNMAFDIAPEDLEIVLARAEHHAADRRRAEQARSRSARRAA
jgi:CBS domain-containing membrane protein